MQSAMDHPDSARINTQNDMISDATRKYQDSFNQSQNLQQQFQNNLANQQNYGDMVRNAREAEGAADARNAYEQSRQALNSTQAMMTNLPMSIGGGSALTQAQRQRIMASQGNSLQRQMNAHGIATQNASQDYQQILANALGLADREYQGQQDRLNLDMQTWQNMVNQMFGHQSNVTTQRNILDNIYAQLYAEQNQAANRASQERIAAQQRAAQQYAADAGLRLQQFMQQANPQGGGNTFNTSTAAPNQSATMNAILAAAGKGNANNVAPYALNSSTAQLMALEQMRMQDALRR